MPKEKIGVCSVCKRMFQNPFERELCPDCFQMMENRFDRVRKYIRQHANAGIVEVSDATGTPQRQILRWVREERLYFAETSGVGVPCLQCGVTIQMGKYCEGCGRKIKKDLYGVLTKPNEEDHLKMRPTAAIKMHVLNRDRK